MIRIIILQYVIYCDNNIASILSNILQIKILQINLLQMKINCKIKI